MNLNDYRNECHKTAREKGWWDTPRVIPELLCLIHSEISEALESYRTSTLPASLDLHFAEELADTLIRIFDLAGRYDIDLDKAVQQKMEKNKLRPYRHGGKKC